MLCVIPFRMNMFTPEIKVVCWWTQGQQIIMVPSFPEDVKCETERNSKARQKKKKIFDL